eukprot:TRINITY_DN31573_c0_g1_i1.p1 TRINITY_DN31573_c0_g1~~TRINITY_DN31573_c0_g1_i1.p1  ORF type:complete len:206 (-),score=1.80 TRINITY_DN31573_c0_g1_i1:27-644(-)
MQSVRNLLVKSAAVFRPAALVLPRSCAHVAFSRGFTASSSPSSSTPSTQPTATLSPAAPRRPLGRRRYKGPIPLKHQKPPIPPMLPKDAVVVSKRFTQFPRDSIYIPKNGVKQKEGTPYKQVTFRTPVKMGKADIREYLEKIYQVKIIKINTLNYEGKLKRTGKPGVVVRTPKYKKAYVTVDDSDDPIVIPAVPEETKKDETKKP